MTVFVDYLFEIIIDIGIWFISLYFKWPLMLVIYQILWIFYWIKIIWILESWVSSSLILDLAKNIRFDLKLICVKNRVFISIFSHNSRIIGVFHFIMIFRIGIRFQIFLSISWLKRTFLIRIASWFVFVLFLYVF